MPVTLRVGEGPGTTWVRAGLECGGGRVGPAWIWEWLTAIYGALSWDSVSRGLAAGVAGTGRQ